MLQTFATIISSTITAKNLLCTIEHIKNQLILKISTLLLSMLFPNYIKYANICNLSAKKRKLF